MDVITVGSNRPADRFYRGGPRITEFRGEAAGSDRQPEDWVGSTTTLAGESDLGLTVLPDGRSLRAAIADDPSGWLGAEHVERFGVDTRLLVKLLDAGQRLPVHAHPEGPFAALHLGRAHGKAEAWFMLTGGEVHVGLRDDIGEAELSALVKSQDVDGLLALLHRIEVRPGDVVYVPPGVLHAVGEGVFLLELQEPEDLSILLEWRDFELDGEQDGHLGLGFDLALRAVEHRGRSAKEMATLVQATGFAPSVLPAEADRYFRLERVRIEGEVSLEAGFAVLVMVDGHAQLDAALLDAESPTDLHRGSTVIAPHAAGPLHLKGQGELLVCRPPGV